MLDIYFIRPLSICTKSIDDALRDLHYLCDHGFCIFHKIIDLCGIQSGFHIFQSSGKAPKPILALDADNKLAPRLKSSFIEF